MKSSKVKAASIPNGTAERSEHEEFEYSLRQESIARQKKFVNLGLEKGYQKFSKITDQLAESDHYMRNEPIPHGLDLFPPSGYLFFMRYSDLFYRYAKGGPLYVDTPISATEIMYCEKKLQAYRSKGVRYTYIKSGEDCLEASMRLDPMDLPKGATA